MSPNPHSNTILFFHSIFSINLISNLFIINLFNKMSLRDSILNHFLILSLITRKINGVLILYSIMIVNYLTHLVTLNQIHAFTFGLYSFVSPLILIKNSMRISIMNLCLSPALEISCFLKEFLLVINAYYL